MSRFMSYLKFKDKVKREYPISDIDQLTYNESHGGFWLDHGMYRWHRISAAIDAANYQGPFTVLDVGAYPFTALKVVKVLFPDAKLIAAGLWDAKISELLQSDSILKDGSFYQCNFDPWVVLPEEKQSVEKGLDIPAESVDFVIFTEVVEHLYNPAHALKEIARVLKPGGRIYLSTNNVAYWFYALRILRGETNLDRDLNQITVDFMNDHPHDWRGHVRFYSIGQLTEMLELAGFTSVILETTFDTTEILRGQLTLSKQIRTWVKGLTNALPFMSRLRGHIEIVAEK